MTDRHQSGCWELWTETKTVPGSGCSTLFIIYLGKHIYHYIYVCLIAMFLRQLVYYHLTTQQDERLAMRSLPQQRGWWNAGWKRKPTNIVHPYWHWFYPLCRGECLWAFSKRGN